MVGSRIGYKLCKSRISRSAKTKYTLWWVLYDRYKLQIMYARAWKMPLNLYLKRNRRQEREISYHVYIYSALINHRITGCVNLTSIDFRRLGEKTYWVQSQADGCAWGTRVTHARYQSRCSPSATLVDVGDYAREFSTRSRTYARTHARVHPLAFKRTSKRMNGSATAPKVTIRTRFFSAESPRSSPSAAVSCRRNDRTWPMRKDDVRDGKDRVRKLSIRAERSGTSCPDRWFLLVSSSRCIARLSLFLSL